MDKILSIGLMSGTSRDGVDAAVMLTDGIEVGEFYGSLTIPYSSEAQIIIAAACGANKENSSFVDKANEIITKTHILAVKKILDKTGLHSSEINIIGFHGHTIHHDPKNSISNQIGDASLLAIETGIDVVSSFRMSDIKAGGQGAPLAPIFHAALSFNLRRPLAVLNLGGVSNVTWIGKNYDLYEPSQKNLCAFDIGPGCALIDDWVQKKKGVLYDQDGLLSKAGNVDLLELSKLMADEYFTLPPPKSLDRDHFDVTALSALTDADGAATLTSFTIEAISRSLQFMPKPPLRWLVTGGGRHNKTIMEGLRANIDVPVEAVEVVGWEGDALEAQAFAWLAVRSLAGHPISYPETTGVPSPQLGGCLVTKDGNYKTMKR